MEPVEIYSGTLFHAQMVKDLLENAGIRAFLKDEITGTRNPMWGSPTGGVKVMVASDDTDAARVLVASFEAP